MMKFPTNKIVHATNGLFSKPSMASTASSSEEYSEDAHHNNVMANKLSDSDSIVSFMDCDEEGMRPSTYLCRFETPFLEWQADHISEHLTLAAGGDIDDDQAYKTGGRLVVSQTSLYSFKCAYGNEPFYPGRRYMFEVLFRKG